MKTNHQEFLTPNRSYPKDKSLSLYGPITQLSSTPAKPLLTSLSLPLAYIP